LYYNAKNPLGERVEGDRKDSIGPLREQTKVTHPSKSISTLHSLEDRVLSNRMMGYKLIKRKYKSNT
jgi:hypothetical protein